MNKDFRSKPEWDSVPNTIKSRLVQDYTALDKVQKSLENKKLDKNKVLLHDKWEDIERKKQNLKESFITSAKTVKANQAYILSIAEKIDEHRKLQDNLDSQIKDLRFQKEYITNIINDMKNFVDKYHIYEEFLEKVVEAEMNSGYNSVGAILNRFESLENVKKELMQRMKETLEKINKVKQEITKITEDKSNLLHTLENKASNLQIKIKEIKERRRIWELIVKRLKILIIKKMEESEAFKLGCWDLYKTVFIRKQNTAKRKIDIQKVSINETNLLSIDDTKSQLEFIQKSIEFYKEVLSIASHKNN
uniref:DUF4200 domain-containing protein n=1 Tax=Clastoptera arizonana TaxID=38151 RepID=A0A1B6DDR7_9HEMI